MSSILRLLTRFRTGRFVRDFFIQFLQNESLGTIASTQSTEAANIAYVESISAGSLVSPDVGVDDIFAALWACKDPLPHPNSASLDTPSIGSPCSPARASPSQSPAHVNLAVDQDVDMDEPADGGDAMLLSSPDTTSYVPSTTGEVEDDHREAEHCEEVLIPTRNKDKQPELPSLFNSQGQLESEGLVNLLYGLIDSCIVDKALAVNSALPKDIAITLPDKTNKSTIVELEFLSRIGFCITELVKLSMNMFGRDQNFVTEKAGLRDIFHKDSLGNSWNLFQRYMTLKGWEDEQLGIYSFMSYFLV
jgi:hypothetical protein